MNDRRAGRWLVEQLPGLVEKGVLGPESAEALRTHYAASTDPAGIRGLGLIVSAILGATLVGAGIILILAHNWDELNRTARTVISFLPLAVAVAISGVTIARRSGSVAWSEGAGSFHMLAVAASIALVSQTWHIKLDFREFLLVWMLLSLPLAYLLRATLPCAVYLAGITTWSFGRYGHGMLWAWPLLALAVPHFVAVARENRRGHRAMWLSAILSVSLAVILWCTIDYSSRALWVPACTGLATALYLVGVRWFSDQSAGWLNPFAALGALGAAGLSIVLTYPSAWHRKVWRSPNRSDVEWYAGVAIECALPLAALAMWWFVARARKAVNPVVAALPLAGCAGLLLASLADAPTTAALLFNGYTLALGIVTLVQAAREDRIGAANAGMAVIAALVTARFFDTNFGFVARGVAFILVGLAFLASNVVMIARRRAAS